MNAVVEVSYSHKGGALRAIVVGGLIAGALDITYAIVSSRFHGVNAVTILQSVASGLQGQTAYEGGTTSAILGLILHFAMMLLIAAIYVWLRRIGPSIVRQSPFSPARSMASPCTS